MKKVVSFVLILIGAIVAIYAQAGEAQNHLVLVVGIVCLMLGVYAISRSIPSKSGTEETSTKEFSDKSGSQKD